MENKPPRALPPAPSDGPEPGAGGEDRAPGHPPAPGSDQWDTLGSTRVLGGGADKTPVQIDVDRLLGPRDDAGAPPVLGDFRIVRKIGQGAMAVVFKAHQISQPRKVALKVLHRHVADVPKLIERFYREARVLGRLDHPNLVQGYSVGEIAGQHFFAMEYVSGESLQKWLNRLGRLSVGDALHIALACASALDHAHCQEIIHRDVKPDNVLISRQGLVKLADMGMVKAMDEDMGLTQTGHAVGTPWYMPLEQARNAKDADHRCDIYALGCMLYCMLTGKPPFTGATLVEVIQAKEIGTFPPARQFTAEVPERLDLVLAKMTAKQAKHRYASCADLIRDLESLGLASKKLDLLTSKPLSSSDASTVLNAGGPTALSSTSGPVADAWYVRLKDKDRGGYAVRKMTTAEVQRGLESGRIGAHALVSRDELTGFRAAAAWKEFEAAALGRATRAGLDRKTAQYRQKFKQLEEEERDRDEEAEESREKTEVVEISDTLMKLLPFILIVLGSAIGLTIVVPLLRSIF